MNVKDKWDAIRALDIRDRIRTMLGNGEDTPEVLGTIRAAEKIAHEAFRAGYDQARRELGFSVKNKKG